MTDAYKRFEDLYAAGKPPPWDSGIVPPEVRRLIEGENPLSPGRALDIGCGTGTSAVYLARHGWQVTGVDWIAAAVTKARVRAEQAVIKTGQTHFLQADITAPDFLPAHPGVSLWLDVGCLHGIDPAARPTYAAHVRRLVLPGGTLLLYAWGRSEQTDQPRGLDQHDLTDLFGPDFALVGVDHGQEVTNTSIPSAWYTLRRTAP